MRYTDKYHLCCAGYFFSLLKKIIRNQNKPKTKLL